MGKFDWNCSECGNLQSKHNQYYDGKCETCNFQLKDDVETILFAHWNRTIGQEPENYEDIVQDVYEYLLSIDKTIAEETDVFEGLRLYKLDEKKMEILNILIGFFSSIGMDRPNNIESILEFVFEDVNTSADNENWSDGDVAIAFRRWIEEQANDDYSQDY